MSYLITQDFPCQHCQFPNSVEVWSVVSVREDPELKDLLLGGELNMAECQSCKKVFHAEIGSRTFLFLGHTQTPYFRLNLPEGQWIVFVLCATKN